MRTQVIVDGYNVLKTSPQFAELERQSLELARDTLVNLLSAKAHLYDITVVFDGWEAGLASQTVQRVRNVRVVYSRRGERADEVIARLAASGQGQRIVVSRDNAVRSFAQGLGCQVAAPEALFTPPKRRGLKPSKTPDEADETAPVDRQRPKKGPARRPKRRRGQPEWRF